MKAHIHIAQVILYAAATFIFYLVMSFGNAEALDCNLSSGRDEGIEALCRYAEKSALAGKWPANPVAMDRAMRYVEVHDDTGTASLIFDTGGVKSFFTDRIDRMHSCYVKKKINMCDVYRTN